MSIVFSKLNRRQFLVGSGGTLLALPILPSLFPSDALAQAASTISPKMLMLHFGHNTHTSAWPSRSIATTALGSDGAKSVPLSSLASSSAISPILSNAVFETLRKKNQITITRGLDNHFFNNGHGSQALSTCPNYRVDQYYPGPFPSLDTVLEASATLYPSSSTPSSVTKVMRINDFEYALSWKKSGSSGVQQLDGYTGVSDMYNKVFASLTGGTTTPVVDTTLAFKSNILNRIYSSYTSAKNSRKISADDKLKLDEHMNTLLEVQKRYPASTGGGTGSTISCNKPTSPTGTSYLTKIPLYYDLLAVSFKCGLSKVGVFGFEGHDGSGVPGFAPSGLTLHNEIFHKTSSATTSDHVLTSYIAWKKWHLDLLASRFLAPLDQQEGTSGRTYLDNMLTVILSESGMENGTFAHNNTDYQTLFLGSMGGAMKAGNYIALPEVSGQRLPYNALLVTLLQLMKIPASEYSAFTSNGKGFGMYGSASSAFSSRFYSGLSELIA